MARSFNQLTLVEYLRRDPESTMVASGDHVTEFTRATDEKKRDGTTATTWFRVSVFGKTVDVAARYLTKESCVYIDGARAFHSASPTRIVCSVDTQLLCAIATKRRHQPSTMARLTEQIDDGGYGPSPAGRNRPQH